MPSARLVKRISFRQAFAVVLLPSATAVNRGTKMNEAPERVLAVFTEALPLSAAERSGYLDRVCAGDGELRRRVEGLLGAYEKAGNFLAEPAAGTPTGTVEGIIAGEKPGDQIGPYKLLQQIGEGGCGVVFMADQEAPVRRRVAVKIVKPGMDSKNVIARFEAERQALALMDHPNIAHVFDAGATASGRPFFVMELIRGIKITDYCDQNSLTTIQRLDLFVQVCNAVQHAHQKGIIHRDIKPSNILVSTSADGKPLPKVIDFGIAKVTTGQRLTDNTVFTAFEMLIGTPAYMSPEQAALTSVDVDTRSDIYSLGVLLYELLTGKTPFDTQELLKAGLDEVRRVIRDQEPVRPSTRLSTMMAPDLTIVSQHHRAEPPKLIREVRGDLDWIVMKALEKDPARRYATANGFAMDVQRYLGSEVVMARPPSAFYKYRKLVARNKLLFGALGLIILLLIAGLGVTTQLLVQERKTHQEADLFRLVSKGEDLYRQNNLIEAEQFFRQALEIDRRLHGPLPAKITYVDHVLELLVAQKHYDGVIAFTKELAGPTNTTPPQYLDLFAVTLERCGKWKQALAYAHVLLDEKPSYHQWYHTVAPLQVAENDLKGYQDTCRKIVARFSTTTVTAIADPMAKDCLILPDSGADLARVAAMAETAVTQGRLDGAYPFYECCKAMAEYRQGHFAQAVEWSEEAAKVDFPYSRAEAYAVLAMSRYQQKDTDGARLTLDQCRDVVEKQLPKFGRSDLGQDWRDWIIAHAWLNEARKLIDPSAPLDTDWMEK